MANFDFKSAVPVTSGLTDNNFFFGAASQAAATPSIYQNVALRAYLLGTSTSTLSIAAGKTLTMTQTLTLPATNGTSGYILSTDGAGVTSWVANTGGTLTVGTTTIGSGTTTRILYDNAGVLGEYTITGTGTVVAMATAPSFTTPTLGVAGATSVQLGTVSSVTGALLLAHASSSFLTTIQAGNAAAARTYTWPTNFGSAGAALTDTAGNGTLAWTVPSTVAGSIVVGTTAITSGTTTRILYDNGGVLGEYTLTGSGTVVAMQTSPSLITPALGVATATSLAVNGATIGSNAVAVTGGIVGSLQVWSGSISSALTTLTGATDGFRSSAANVTQLGAENTTASSATQGGFVGMYSNDGAALASGDRLGGVRAGGSSSASAIRNSAVIAAFASEAWVDASAYGSRWEFQTTTNTTTTATTKAILSNAGLFALGATLANTVPGMKASSTTMAFRLADDSADAPISAAGSTWSGNMIFATDNAYDIGASGATRPRSYYGAANVVIAGYIQIGDAGIFTSTNRGSLGFSADGVFILRNGAGSSFDRLQFGGSTSSFPSLKRSSTAIQVRLADDSAYAPFSAELVTVAAGTATPAAGSTAARLLFGTTSGFGIYYGSGAPTVSAAQGSIYLRSDGSGIADRMYVNTTGSTTWTNFVTAA